MVQAFFIAPKVSSIMEPLEQYPFFRILKTLESYSILLIISKSSGVYVPIGTLSFSDSSLSIFK